ncbi:MAG: hypothetical protein QM658_15255 [Gordonia sp. (in: high G+C Gram-positive bacteria)]
MRKDVAVPEYLSYEEFGRRFFEVAVTEDRIGAAFSAVAGEEFQVGPLPSGPGGMVKVNADVRIAEPQITRHVGELITFEVKLPLFIGLLIDLKLDRIHYDVDGLITLPLTVRCAAPLQLRIEVEPPRPRDVFVDVASRNMRGEFIRNLAQVDAEIRRVIAKFVADEIEKPEVRNARFIDVAGELSRALEGGADAAAEQDVEVQTAVQESADADSVDDPVAERD